MGGPRAGNNSIRSRGPILQWYVASRRQEEDRPLPQVNMLDFVLNRLLSPRLLTRTACLERTEGLEGVMKAGKLQESSELFMTELGQLTSEVCCCLVGRNAPSQPVVYSP